MEAYKAVPSLERRDPTLFEIAGRPHLESVASNVLAFYLQPAHPHGLGMLVLDALCHALGFIDLHGSPEDEVTVEREVTTNTGKRIDIVVTTPGFVLGIENKVLHHLHNDLDEYRAYLEYRYPSCQVFVVVLSLRPPLSAVADGYPVVLYRELFGRVREGLGEPSSDDRLRYRINLLDFMETMDRLEESSSVHRDTIRFLAEHETGVDDLVQRVKGVRREVESKLKVVSERLVVPEDLGPFRQAYWPWRLGSFLYYDFTPVVGVTMAVDIYLSPSGWQLSFKAKEGKAAVMRWLEVSGVKHRPHPEEHDRFLYADDGYGYFELEPERVAEIVQGEALDKLVPFDTSWL